MTELTREDAQRVAELADAAAVEWLSERGMLTPGGLEALLSASRSLIRDDPAVGERLAEVARECAVASASPVAVPRADYLIAQAKAGAGEMAEALALIESARAAFDSLGHTTEALRTNLGRSQALNEMGRHDEALAACAEILTATATSDASRDPSISGLMAAAHQNSGLCLELSGRFEEALDHYASATIGYESLGDSRAVAEVTYDRGLVLLNLGQHAEALATLQRSAAAFREGGFRALMVMALANTAEVQLHRGEYQQCLASLAEASDALEGISSPGGEQVRLMVAGRAYLALNLLPEALSSFTSALALLEGTDLVIDRARALWGQGLALARTGRSAAASAALADAADQFRRSGQTAWLAEVLVDDSRLHRSSGHLVAARRAAGAALDLAPDGAPSQLSARLLLAELQEDGDVLAALADTVRAAEALGLAPLTAQALHSLGRAEAAAGHRGRAIATLRSAVTKVEALRGNLAHELVLTRFLDDKLSPYEDLLTALLDDGTSPEAALQVAEQAKSRTLSDVVSGLAVRGRRDDDALDNSDEDLRALYGELFSGEAAVDPARAERLRQRVRDLEAQRDLALLRGMPVAPDQGTTDIGSGTPSPLVLPDDGVCVSYAAAGGWIHAFVVERAGVFAARRLAPIATVAALVDRLRRQWDRFRLGADVIERHLPQMERSTVAVLGDLYDALVAPLWPRLRAGNAHRLVVIPEAPLHDVPFHALWGEEGPVLDHFEVSYSPSLDMLRHLPSRRRGTSVVAGVADELAPMVEREVAAVSALLPDSRAFVGSAAVWDVLGPQLLRAAHIHLAGHAMFRPDNPMYSALRLHDRWITAADVFALDMGGATVVLSACDTARTELASGAEINGFVRGFLGAGAATVVAAQWAADDRATAAFMDELYLHLGDRTPADAVRRAQQAVRARWPHPYYWAPWVVLGRSELLDGD